MERARSRWSQAVFFLALGWLLAGPLGGGGGAVGLGAGASTGALGDGEGAAAAAAFLLGAPGGGGGALTSLLGRALALLPLGEVATRLSLLGALALALAAVGVARLVAALLDGGSDRGVVGASASGSAGDGGARAAEIAGAGSAAVLVATVAAAGPEARSATAGLAALAAVTLLRLLRATSATGDRRAGLAAALVAGLTVGIDVRLGALVAAGLGLGLLAWLRRGDRWPLLAPLTFAAGALLVLYRPLVAGRAAAFDWGAAAMGVDVAVATAVDGTAAARSPGAGWTVALGEVATSIERAVGVCGVLAAFAGVVGLWAGRRAEGRWVAGGLCVLLAAAGGGVLTVGGAGGGSTIAAVALAVAAGVAFGALARAAAWPATLPREAGWAPTERVAAPDAAVTMAAVAVTEPVATGVGRSRAVAAAVRPGAADGARRGAAAAVALAVAVVVVAPILLAGGDRVRASFPLAEAAPAHPGRRRATVGAPSPPSPSSPPAPSSPSFPPGPAGSDVLRDAPARALVLLHSPAAIDAALYQTAVRGLRPDVTVLVEPRLVDGVYLRHAWARGGGTVLEPREVAAWEALPPSERTARRASFVRHLVTRNLPHRAILDERPSPTVPAAPAPAPGDPVPHVATRSRSAP